jgi:hypothetical protein
VKPLRPSSVILELHETAQRLRGGHVPDGCRRCSGCDEVKSQGLFPKRRGHQTLGPYFANLCKECLADRRKRKESEPYVPEVNEML